MSGESKVPLFNLFAADELDETMEAAASESPTLRAAMADAMALKVLIDELVRQRKEAGLTQTDVARLMDVRQPTVSQFETESSDPRLSTLQRYARAVGCGVSLHVMSARGVFAAHEPYEPSSHWTGMRPDAVTIKRNSLCAHWAAEQRSDFAPAA
jgi:transcriptional regulator with XRE-family HTH domain